jgi:hypothetical protein
MGAMIRTQIQFPDPLFRRLEAIALEQSWSLSETMQKAAEQFVDRFPNRPEDPVEWQFPILDCGGDFLRDPATAGQESAPKNELACHSEKKNPRQFQ